MLKHQPWSLGSKAPALCPKCNAAAMYRSHTHTTLEEKRKQYGSKRPYRCHECGWRGWVEEAHLRYSSEIISYQSKDSVTEDLAIPDIQLDDTVNGQKDNHAESEVRDSRWNGSASVSLEAPVAEADDQSIPEDIRMDEPMGAAMESVGSDDQRMPEIDDDAVTMVSQKVPVGFHHHSRHTVKVCPKCGEPSLYRSRSRSLGETIKKKLTFKRPYRCHKCGWRGWLSRGF